jgi:hypothetical protein
LPGGTKPAGHPEACRRLRLCGRPRSEWRIALSGIRPTSSGLPAWPSHDDATATRIRLRDLGVGYGQGCAIGLPGADPDDELDPPETSRYAAAENAPALGDWSAVRDRFGLVRCRWAGPLKFTLYWWGFAC